MTRPDRRDEERGGNEHAGAINGLEQKRDATKQAERSESVANC